MVLNTALISFNCAHTVNTSGALVINQLDCCGSIYAGLPLLQFACLEWVLRVAPRLLGSVAKFGHVSDEMQVVLQDVLWLVSCTANLIL